MTDQEKRRAVRIERERDRIGKCDFCGQINRTYAVARNGPSTRYQLCASCRLAQAKAEV